MTCPPWMPRLVAEIARAPGERWSRFLPPPGGGRRASAVLMLFGAGVDGRTEVVLTERSHGMRSHAGQVSFPGGGREEADDDLAATALREAQEEIGLDPGEVEVVAVLPALHIPVSGYDVTPVLAWWPRRGRVFVRQPGEVAQVVTVAVDDLIDPANRFTARHASGFRGPAFATGDLVVWGFTAGLLDRVLELSGLTRPWDSTDVREVRT